MKYLSLGELCDVSIGRTPARANKDYWGIGWPWLSIADMNQGRDLLRTKEQITNEAVQKTNCRILAPGTVVVSFKLSIGKVGIVRVPMATNEAIAALMPRSNQLIEPEYLAYVLASMDLSAGANRAVMGGTLNKTTLSAVRIPVPSIEEQRRVTSILDKADALRTARREAIAHLDGLGQSIFRAMFGGVRTIGLASKLSFVTSGGRGWAKYYAESGKRFIRSLDVQKDELASGAEVFVNPPDSAEARRTAVQGGDVLLTITGSLIGRAASVPDALHESFVSQHVAILRSPTLESRFLSGFLNSDSGQQQIRSAQYGQTKPGLNFGQIREFEIPDASRELQREFASRIAAVDALKSSHRVQLAELDNLFLSLQDRAFKGQL